MLYCMIFLRSRVFYFFCREKNFNEWMTQLMAFCGPNAVTSPGDSPPPAIQPQAAAAAAQQELQGVFFARPSNWKLVRNATNGYKWL